MRIGGYYNQKRRKEMNGPQAAVVKYDEESGKAPIVVAQGKGRVAQQIIELAKENDIQIQEDSALVCQSIRYGFRG